MHRHMIRNIALGLVATLACSHPSSLRNGQTQPVLDVDSNYVSGDELWDDVRQGHTTLYDALRSTRPEILRSGSEGLQVYFDNPLGFAHCCFRISDLRRISTAQVKWIRRYAPGTAPPQLNYYSGVLLVALR
jgi:hypothetical protein